MLISFASIQARHEELHRSTPEVVPIDQLSRAAIEAAANALGGDNGPEDDEPWIA